jgi:hypothetical protein
VLASALHVVAFLVGLILVAFGAWMRDPALGLVVAGGLLTIGAVLYELTDKPEPKPVGESEQVFRQ